MSCLTAKTPLIAALCLAWAIPLQAAYAPITQVANVVTWTDSTGNPRSMTFDATRPQVLSMTYYIGASLISNTWVNHRVGQMVNHGSCGATVSSGSSSSVVKSVALAGADHYIVRYTFNEPMCGSGSNWRITEDWEFVNGRDAYVETVAYDSSNIPAATAMGEDMRGPYSQTNWLGAGVASGVAWGDEWKFKTTSAINCGSCTFSCGPGTGPPTPCNTTWTYGGTNTIPYVLTWALPGVYGGTVDREWGIVQNIPTSVMDFGGAYYGSGGMPTVAAIQAGTSGTVMPECWAVPGQHNCYDSAWNSGRTTWGTIFGTFENGHSNASYTRVMGNIFRPVAGWSWINLIDAASNSGVAKLVTDTENIYASTLTASVGSVITVGPRGPGTNVGPGVGGQVVTGVMPTMTYAKAGFDHIYRTWNLTAAGGNVSCNLNVSGGLTHPGFVIFGVSSLPCLVTLAGIPQVLGTDYMADYDAANTKVWLTFNKDLAAGANLIEINTNCGSPTSTQTVCGACTSTQTSTVTPTFTATPSSCPIISYNGEAGAPNRNLASGGAWANPAPSSATEGAAGARSGAAGLIINLNWTGWWGGMGWNWASWTPGNTFDLSSATAVEFWIRSSAGTINGLNVQLVDIVPTASPNVALSGYLAGGVTTTWQKVSIPLSAFTGMNKATAAEFDFNTSNSASGNITFYVDDLVFIAPCPVNSPTPSPATTPTETPTVTPTATPSATPSPSSTPSGTPTDTPSASATPTITESFTASPAVSPTNSPSITETFTVSETSTETGTPSVTETSSPTPSASPTVTLSRTPTPTFTATASPTATTSRTPTPTFTATRSITPSYTASPPLTATPSSSITPTRTVTATSTSTVTPSATPSSTATLTTSPSNSATPSITQTWTASPVNTATLTASATSTNSPVNTATATSSMTPTNTPSPTAAGTLSPTAITLGGPPDVLALMPVPNPQAGSAISLAMNLLAPADALEIRVYTHALAVAGVYKLSGLFPAGWSNARFDCAPLAAGIYFVTLKASAGSAKGKESGTAKLMWLP